MRRVGGVLEQQILPPPPPPPPLFLLGQRPNPHPGDSTRQRSLGLTLGLPLPLLATLKVVPLPPPPPPPPPWPSPPPLPPHGSVSRVGGLGMPPPSLLVVLVIVVVLLLPLGRAWIPVVCLPSSPPSLPRPRHCGEPWHPPFQWRSSLSCPHPLPPLTLHPPWQALVGLSLAPPQLLQPHFPSPPHPPPPPLQQLQLLLPLLLPCPPPPLGFASPAEQR